MVPDRNEVRDSDRQHGTGGSTGVAFDDVPVLSPEDRGEQPVCQVGGCEREGVASQKFRERGDPQAPVTEEYVCQYHRRLLLAVKLVLATAVVTAFLVAFFQF